MANQFFLKDHNPTDVISGYVLNLQLKLDNAMCDFDEGITHHMLRIRAADLLENRHYLTDSEEFFVKQVSKDALTAVKKQFDILQDAQCDLNQRIHELRTGFTGIRLLEGEEEVSMQTVYLPKLVEDLGEPLTDGMSFVFIMNTSHKAVRFTWIAEKDGWEMTDLNYDDFTAYFINLNNQAKEHTK